LAVKVIKLREPKPALTRFTCGGCGSFIEAGKDDGKYINDQRDGDCVSIRCPVCGRESFISVGHFK
jgi:RNase P subunit RPR2